MHTFTHIRTHNMYLSHKKNYRVSHGFEQAKFADGGSILGWSQFSLLLKMMLNLKVVKIDKKIIIWLC